MKFFKHQTDFILLLFFLLLMLATPLAAEAYIDPGTGSFIVQAIIASIVGTAFYFKFFARKIGGLFTRDKENKSNKMEAETIDEDKQ